MEFVGDDSAGFSFGFDPAKDGFAVRAWGFWGVDVATAFAVQVVALLRSRPGTKRLVLDMAELKPMREEGQQSFASVCRALGATSATIVTSSHMTKLQLLRIATESGVSSAIQWLGASPR